MRDSNRDVQMLPYDLPSGLENCGRHRPNVITTPAEARVTCRGVTFGKIGGLTLRKDQLK